MCIGVLLHFSWRALKSLKKLVRTIGFLDLLILVHSPWYVALTQLVIVKLKFVSSELRLTDLPAGFC